MFLGHLCVLFSVCEFTALVYVCGYIFIDAFRIYCLFVDVIGKCI